MSRRAGQYRDVVVRERYLCSLYPPLTGGERKGPHPRIHLLEGFVRRRCLSPSFSPVCPGHVTSLSK
ncbi:hypothetical protein BCAR13_410045 [Paraburkholderia caribensis]|nr:hypothetical protein BCAR13_410045 [Paraburkholderia caribensis]